MSLDRLISKGNSIVIRLLRSPLHWLVSPGLMLITVTGRKTARRYTLPVGYHRDGEDLVILVSEAPKKIWWRNLRVPCPVEIRVRGKELRGVARLVAPGSADFTERLEYVLCRVPGLARGFGIHFHRRSGLTDSQVAKLAQEVAVVRVASVEVI